jgi:hypothetical protein
MSLRRPMLVAAVLGVVGLVVSGVLGHIVMGILVIVGMIMGIVNSRMLQKSVAHEVGNAAPSSKAVGFASAQRLVIITVIALALGYFVRPDGLGVFFGLALFQFIVIGNTALPVMKERRKHE